MLSEWLDKLAMGKRQKEYRRSQKLRAKNDKNPPNHKGWSPMINTGSGGMNKTTGGNLSAENLVAQREILINKRKEIIEQKK